MSVMKRERASRWPVERIWPDERIDRAFRDMFRDFFSGGPVVDRFLESGHLLRVEEYVDDGACVVKAELPGIDPDKDVEITVADGVLHLRASREERKEEDRPSGYHSEFRYGSFERVIRLPENASESDVKASYKDGMLEVRIPVAEAPVEPTGIKIPVVHD